MTKPDRPEDKRGELGSTADSPVHRLSDAALARGRSGAARLTVLSGSSGVGKNTVVARLRAKRPDIWLSVSVTTRSPRPGEVNGREYDFVSDEAFDAMVARGELLEWATSAGRKYGTPKVPVDERAAAGVPTLLSIDLAGARQVRRGVPGALLVFLVPPSREKPAPPACRPGTEPPDLIERRLDMARREMEAAREFDITLVNTSVKEVCQQLVALTAA